MNAEIDRMISDLRVQALHERCLHLGRKCLHPIEPKRSDPMPKTAKTPKPKTEATIAVRPRVGSALAQVRASVVSEGGNMGEVIHGWADRHLGEVIPSVAEVEPSPDLPSFD